jgi:hypothetical protein
MMVRSFARRCTLAARLALGVATIGGARQLAAQRAPLWPMQPGSRYEWRGTVTWTPAGTADTIRREAHWMTTVHTVATRAARQVAIVDGLPQAMLLARGTDEPRFAVVASDSAHVWVRECASRAAADSTAAAWLQGATLLDDVLLLRLPATIGDRWPDQAMKVADGFFEWTVTAATAPDPVPGARAAPGARAWEVTMHTAPEMRVVTVVPGIGIVRYWHLHFGRTQRIVLALARVIPPRTRGAATGERAGAASPVRATGRPVR